MKPALKPTVAMQKVIDHRAQFNPECQKVRCKLLSCEVYFYERNGQPCARGYRGRALKPAFALRYRSAERRTKHVSEFMAACHEQAASKKVESNKTRTLEIGNVLVASWGYDQTNIDYYMVTQLIGKAMVEVCKIGKDTNPTEFMQGECIPDKSNIIGEPMRKNPDGDTIKVGHTWARLIKPEIIAGVEIYAKSHYSSYH